MCDEVMEEKVSVMGYSSLGGIAAVSRGISGVDRAKFSDFKILTMVLIKLHWKMFL